jgi:ribonucleoside-diphosphate reductase alpha chain
VEDNLESIFSTLKMTARIHQSGGGTGFSFSKMRPRNDYVRSTGGISSGPISFIELFDHATSVIRQGGRRRGANMAVLRVDHPDIMEFIQSKRTPGRLENFNLSVGITDEYLATLRSNRPLALRNPRTGSIEREIDARHLFEEMTHSAWMSGEPGAIFLDEINRANPIPALGEIEATNPCGEQPLLPYESCTLGSINLKAFARPDTVVDWPRLREAVHDSVVFLDNVIEANSYPYPEIAQATLRTRKIGLGVMGLADLFATAEIAYDSTEAIRLAEKIAEFITNAARDMSAKLGEQRGSFPAFEASVWPSRGFSAMRNATVTCVAPTGTLSIIADVSSGIEPFFALVTRRRTLDNREFVATNRILMEKLAPLGEAGRNALKMAAETGTLESAQNLPEHLRAAFRTALQIPWQAHLGIQAAFQRHVDAAVSKTINLSRETTSDTIGEIFTTAARLRLKGVTVYRYGSRTSQVLSIVGENPECRECAV